MAPRYIALLALLPFAMASTEAAQPMGTEMTEQHASPVMAEMTPEAPAEVAAETFQAGPAVISHAQTQSVIDAAIKKANEIKTPMNIAITDPAGHLVSFLRMDGAALVSIDIAQKKARTVSLFGGKFRSGDLFNATNAGGPLYGMQQTNSGLVFLGGGIPLTSGGKFVGAVGVSGGQVDQDVQVATAAASSFK